MVAHSGLCAAAGVYGGSRVFAAEERGATLEGLLLLPHPANRWLALKLAFPLYLVLLVWSAGIPLYVCGAVFRWMRPHDIPGLLVFPLAGGLNALALTLLIARDPRRTDGGDTTPRQRRQKSDREEHWLLVPLAVLAGMMPILRAATKGVGSVSIVFGLRVPDWILALLVALAVPIAGWATARAVVAGDDDSAWPALNVRRAAVVVLCYLLVGVFVWGRTPDWLGWVLVIGIPVFAWWDRIRASTPPDEAPKPAGRRGKRRQKPRQGRSEDPLAGPELRWLESRWNNPVFIRDLRIYTRTVSIRRALLAGWAGVGQWLFLILLMDVLAAPARGRSMMLSFLEGLRGPALTAALDTAAWIAGLMSVFSLVFGPLVRLPDSGSEPETGPDPSLATPLRSREILVGRMAAAVLHSWSRSTPALLILALSLGWGLARGSEHAPAAVAFLPLLLVLAIPSSVPDGLPRDPEWIPAPYQRHFLYLFMLQSATVCGGVWIMSNGGSLPGPILWCLVLTLFGVNAVLLRKWLGFTARLMDHLRQAEPSFSRSGD